MVSYNFANNVLNESKKFIIYKGETAHCSSDNLFSVLIEISDLKMNDSVSEYKIKDKILAPDGKNSSVFSHHIPVFCLLYILSSSYYNINNVYIINIKY